MPKRICVLAMLAANGLLLQGSAVAHTAPPAMSASIETEAGPVVGRVLPSGVRAYLGVPFAAPPVGKLRWRANQPVTSWTQARAADRFAPDCMQTARPSGGGPAIPAKGSSEDCLYLNIWAPADTAAKHAVVFYIYGGGFSMGSSAEPRVAGEALARKGVVFVSVNYRVGALGFLAHPELSAESTHKVSGNYGLLDQIAGLAWVKRNVARFGGDAGNVTIMGHSAGSMSVTYLQTSRLATGLFEKGVGLSGSSFFVGTLGVDTTLSQGETAGTALQRSLGAHSLADLRALSADKILQAKVASPSRNPVIDGYVLPDRAEKIFARGAQNDVPMIIGFTADESFTPIGQAKTLDSYKALAKQQFGDKARGLLQLYPASTDSEARRASIDAGRDQSLGNMTKGWAMGQNLRGHAPIYVFRFSRLPQYTPENLPKNPFSPLRTAYHGADIAFWLGTQDAPTRDPAQAYAPYDRALGDEMNAALLRFVRTGNPASATLSWPAFTPAHPLLLELGDKVQVTPWPSLSRLGFFDAFSTDPLN